jgi:hypothetical protein
MKFTYSNREASVALGVVVAVAGQFDVRHLAFLIRGSVEDRSAKENHLTAMLDAADR